MQTDTSQQNHTPYHKPESSSPPPVHPHSFSSISNLTAAAEAEIYQLKNGSIIELSPESTTMVGGEKTNAEEQALHNPKPTHRHTRSFSCGGTTSKSLQGGERKEKGDSRVEQGEQDIVDVKPYFNHSDDSSSSFEPQDFKKTAPLVDEPTKPSPISSRRASHLRLDLSKNPSKSHESHLHLDIQAYQTEDETEWEKDEKDDVLGGGLVTTGGTSSLEPDPKSPKTPKTPRSTISPPPMPWENIDPPLNNNTGKEYFVSGAVKFESMQDEYVSLLLDVCPLDFPD